MVGDKLDTTRLGLATMLLSAVALTAAVALRRLGARPDGMRLAVILGLAIPGLVGFTTVGALWLLPVVALLAVGLGTEALRLTARGQQYRPRLPPSP